MNDRTNTPPAAPATLGELLRERAARIALVDEKGAASAERLAEYLDERGVRCTVRSVESWFRGERAPRYGKMEMVLDALDVYGEDRLLAYHLAAVLDAAADSHGSPQDSGALAPTS
jgi:hypothetical protein